MTQLHLTKFNGAGNSFLIVDLIASKEKKSNAQALKKSSRVAWAKRLCDIHWGIGADGFIILEKGKKYSTKSTELSTENKNLTVIKWDFYNADGSRAEMCGNAARCVGHYLSTQFSSSDFLIQTKAGVVGSRVLELSINKLDALVDVNLTAIRELELGLTAKSIEYDYINSGVPHAVVQFSKLHKFFQKRFKNEKIYAEMSNIVTKVRNEKRFLKSGTNVTFLCEKTKNKILSLTFERGVPSFTLACGTGATAAAVSYLNGGQGNVSVQVPGGNLQVLVDGISPRLIGPSEQMAEFVVSV